MEEKVKKVIEELAKEDKWIEEVKNKINHAEITKANILCFTVEGEEGMVIIDLGTETVYKAQEIKRSNKEKTND